ncbi:AAA+-type ATPase [Heterobasidion irregulare TC 32-1]|uniref:AAA+-type ATPase n=1 Tax=Heterobasidion irregulare (strain TC 32-1) TaxID=747525 RepID=W4JXU1_HETIT|nr:AAA+-type ATPase [Heterobasidion irregulare TC 32-1]ETW78392.1 AAA+-type ATPase [Heterobasidion irregulare TC 32-1]
MFTDVEQFLDPKTESWYHKKGVPYHRGYLLYGPPGSGKTSTVHALASRFDLEVYVVSISGAKISDVSLGKLISSIPKGAILLIEDIDCIFPPSFRNDSTRLDPHGLPLSDPFEGQSRVTLSGMLNMLDGAASESGRIVFATTNHLEALDPALIRAGRFDVKVEYKLASPEQGIALFRHFFPESDAATAETFAKAIPHMELSMADISGYLIKYRDATLEKTVADAAEWARREVSGKCRLKCLQTGEHSLRSESSDLGARTLFSCSPNFSMSPNVEKRNLDSPLRGEVQVAEDEAGYPVEDS